MPRNGINESLEEARMVMCGAVSDLLEKTGAGRLSCGRAREGGSGATDALLAWSAPSVWAKRC